MKPKRIKFAISEDAMKASKWAEEKYGPVFERLAKAGDAARKRVSTYSDDKRASLEERGRAAIKKGKREI